MSKVVVRFAPSPTGPLHMGGARTALFNYLFAKQVGGRIILRLEDTDQERSRPEYEDNIRASLAWLQLDFDEVYRQSERGSAYRQELERLFVEDKIYVSSELVSEGESNKKRSEVIRFRNPGSKITFNDLVRGEITFDTTELGDFVIARSIDEPLYHFAVVVDDWQMGVTHVIRAEDHISNTPRQILIQEALGAPRPIYAHIPLILAPDRSKLSKRHGAVSVTEYRDQGYLSAAVINYLALLGWNPGTDQEIFSRGELIKNFSLERIQRGGAIFNLEKLKWLNRQYLREVGEDTWLNYFPAHWPVDMRRRLIPIFRERVDTLSDVAYLVSSGEYDYFLEAPAVDRERLKTPETLPRSVALLEALPEDKFTQTEIKEILWPYAEEVGRAKVLWPIRVALSGKDKSPDPFTIASVLGKEETISRLRKFI